MNYNHDIETEKLKLNTLPNRLSLIRIICVPLVVFFLIDANENPFDGLIAAALFGVAGITDYFDGYYARLEKAVTMLGKLLDPLADKFLVVSSLIMLMKLERINAIVVILLICRELAITGLRAIAATEGIVISASNLGKWKTATQMSAIPILMLEKSIVSQFIPIPYLKIGTVLIYISLVISLWSAKDYIVDFFKNLKRKK
jgi:CDP-diacylglycerol--glycerol-3-phosphate 3-phosphatidyltransferase